MPIIKNDNFNKFQCLKNEIERNQMRDILYACAVGSLMYTQVCTYPDISFVLKILDRY